MARQLSVSSACTRWRNLQQMRANLEMTRTGQRNVQQVVRYGDRERDVRGLGGGHGDMFSKGKNMYK
eukprot:5726028-Amphidinium_carterae.1